MKEQARLREEMMYQYKLGNFEAAAAIQKRLDPDVPICDTYKLIVLLMGPQATAEPSKSFHFRQVSEYEKELEDVKDMTREECVAYLRRRSSCFSRGASIYRGVTRQKDGRWQARIGLVADTRDIYLGTFKTEEEAAEAYDIAAVELRGRNAVTNFDISNYIDKGPKREEEAMVVQQL